MSLFPKYKLPEIDLLDLAPQIFRNDSLTLAALRKNLDLIVETLQHFGISLSNAEVSKGSSVTRYDIYPVPGIRAARVSGLMPDLSRALCAKKINFIPLVPDKYSMAIEVPNEVRTIVSLREVFESPTWIKSEGKIPLALGKDVYCQNVEVDLAEIHHLLIAGTAESGISVCINCILVSLLYRFRPDELRLVLIDPKGTELQVYNPIPHLVMPVVTDPKKVLLALRWVIKEMEVRYRILSKVGLKNINSFNSRTRHQSQTEQTELGGTLLEDEEEDDEKIVPASELKAKKNSRDTDIVIPDHFPYVVVVIDELADLMQTSAADIESAIVRLTGRCHAVGIHLIVATQTPHQEVITDLIKTSIPSRLAFRVSSPNESSIILDENGAENLLGQGDFLYLPPDSRPIRGQGPLVSDNEVKKVVDFVSARTQFLDVDSDSIPNAPSPLTDGLDIDTENYDLLSKCLEVMRNEKRASTSMLQRRLRLGYNKAAWIMDCFEHLGIVGPENGAKPREILVDLEKYMLPPKSPLSKVSDRGSNDPLQIVNVTNELNRLTGLTTVKAEFKQAILVASAMMKRRAAGFTIDSPSYHSVFSGSPGTGKTTVARLMGSAYRSLGVLKRGHVVEVSRSDLVGEWVGSTAVKTRKKLEEALDGILFVDEAYTLTPTIESNDFGKEAVAEILQFMETHRDRLIVIAAGYEDRMVTFINANPGLKSRFTKFIKFEDFNPPELVTIFEEMTKKGSYRMTPEFKIRLLVTFNEMYEKRDEKFGNARDVRNLFEGCQSRYLARISTLIDSNPPMDSQDLAYKDITRIEEIVQGGPEFSIFCSKCHHEMRWLPTNAASIRCVECQEFFPGGWGLLKGSEAYNASRAKVTKTESLTDLLSELEGMTGLSSVKTLIKRLINSLTVQQAKRRRGLPVGASISLHMVFTGSPGTGKTTIARLVGKIFRAMGILSRGHFLEVDRSNLVGPYIGHTEQITSKKLDEAMDGILFIDEAYSLTARNIMGNDSGPIAVETILKRMEDSRNRLVVIAAGYQEEMKQFIDSNPGLASRFSNHIHFEDYTPEELVKITNYMAKSSGMIISSDLQEKILEFFKIRYESRSRSFSNARLARNLLEKIYSAQTSRISNEVYDLSNEDVLTLKIEDWPLDAVLNEIS